MCVLCIKKVIPEEIPNQNVLLLSFFLFSMYVFSMCVCSIWYFTYLTCLVYSTQLTSLVYLAYLSHLMYLTYLTYITLVGQVVLFGLLALFGRCVVFGLDLFGIYVTYFVIFIGLFTIITYSIYLARNGKTEKRRDKDTETQRNGETKKTE